MRGAAVDATVIRYMRPQLVKQSGSTFELVNDLLKHVGIVVDRQGFIEEEWCRQPGSRRDELLEQWVAAEYLNGRIRHVQPTLDEGVVRRLRVEFGFSQSGSRDLDYVKCANVTETRYILAEDIDFFDPTAARGTRSARRRAKDERRGTLCRYLKDELEIRVGACCHCRSDLGL